VTHGSHPRKLPRTKELIPRETVDFETMSVEQLRCLLKDRDAVRGDFDLRTLTDLRDDLGHLTPHGVASPSHVFGTTPLTYDGSSLLDPASDNVIGNRIEERNAWHGVPVLSFGYDLGQAKGL
jgi:hypothetical protein